MKRERYQTVAQLAERRAGNDDGPSNVMQISGRRDREVAASAQISHHAKGESSRNTAEVGRSSRPRLITLFDAARERFAYFRAQQKWDQGIGLSECPYMRRWIAWFAYSLRLHYWRASDDARHFHDHPWWFVTIVLWGSYVDVSPAGRDRLRMGSIRFRPAHHRHTVEIEKPGTITLVLTGRDARRWGFWVNDKLIRRDKYFAVWGHHPCDAQGAPVRMRPDGTPITEGQP